MTAFSAVKAGAVSGSFFSCSIKWWFAIGMLVVFTGCPGSSNLVESPKIDAAAAAAAAISQYDTDGDASLSNEECKSSAFDFLKWDANADGKLAESEIVQRLSLYGEHGAGLKSLTCVVMFNGRPLEHGKVIFEPEPFLGNTIEAAEGTVDQDGTVMLSIPKVVAEDPVLTGVRPGLYKVKITHSDVQVPAKYNEETGLGFDVSPLEQWNPPVFRLRK